MSRTLRVGTRQSRLALAQTRWVIERLKERAPRLEVAVVPIRTTGDVDRTTPLAQMGGRGVFVTEVERALAAGEVDFAVHSYKDLPTSPAEGLTIAAVPGREDVRDALVTRTGVGVDDLPAGARVGTGSPRRQAQLAAYRPDLTFEAIRGNVETRRGRVGSGEFDATVLALAGLRRAGLLEGAVPIPLSVLLPAPGQGALALQCRADDPEVAALLRLVDDAAAHAGADAERSLLALLRGGCHAPVGAYCRPSEEREGEWILDACVADPEGRGQARVRVAGGSPAELAHQAYAALKDHEVVRTLLGGHGQDDSGER